MMGRLHSFRLLRPTFSVLLLFSIQQTSSAPASEGRVKIPRPLAHAQSRSRALIARHADKQIRYGFDLAERGAVYSAQNKFIDALGTISYVLDAEHGTRTHSQALIAGLKALREVEDFLPRDWSIETCPGLAGLIAVHQTPVLKDVPERRLTPLVAIQSYYLYAEAQLATAGGHEPAASKALYGLARVQSHLATAGKFRIPTNGPKAVALHRAALRVAPNNYTAANELGVLLDHYGQLPDAKLVFLQSLSVSPQPETWHNLSVVYQKLGNGQEAQRARQWSESMIAAERTGGRRAATSSPRSAASATSLIRWVDLETFAINSDQNGVGPAAIPSQSVGPLKNRETSTKRKRKFELFGHRSRMGLAFGRAAGRPQNSTSFQPPERNNTRSFLSKGLRGFGSLFGAGRRVPSTSPAAGIEGDNQLQDELP